MNYNSETLNPYESPQLDGPESPEYSHSEFSAVLGSWGLESRRLLLSGPYPCVIDYNGLGVGYETVLLDGTIAARVFNNGFKLAPRLDFELPAPKGPIPARIEVKTRWCAFMGGLRLIVGDQVVYSEGRW